MKWKQAAAFRGQVMPETKLGMPPNDFLFVYTPSSYGGNYRINFQVFKVQVLGNAHTKVASHFSQFSPSRLTHRDPDFDKVTPRATALHPSMVGWPPRAYVKANAGNSKRSHQSVVLHFSNSPRRTPFASVQGSTIAKHIKNLKM